MRSKKRVISLMVVLMYIVTLFPVSSVDVSANAASLLSDATDSIESSFSDYQIGQKISLSSDGRIGIPVEMTVYFDKQNHTACAGYDGTTLIIYVVNTNTERIGKSSDTQIIKDFIDKGYIVYVLDYLNNEKAMGQELDYSVQLIRTQIESGKHNPDSSVIPNNDSYYSNHVVPAGYTVSLGHVFFEIDKHAADGTLEKIVEIWNNDFKHSKPGVKVKWVHEDGSRKKVATASDGTAPVWYNESGEADANGQYVCVKHTVAEKITDCVEKDGTPIEMKQYMHVVYPTGGVKVPVIALASSAGRVTTSTTSADIRPHMTGALFRGYAGIVYDYMWVPMAESDSYGYFDGSTGNTGDHMNYSVQMYSEKELNTAAMRYIRYLALSEGETFNFDINSIGVIGNSKGGWFAYLGEKHLRSPLVDKSQYTTSEEHEDAISSAITSFYDGRTFLGHHGESRYENGLTEDYTIDGFTIHGGEKQPWLTYNGEEILSGANLVYTSNGPNAEDISEGYAPAFLVACMYDDYDAAYGDTNQKINIYRNLDIPSLFFDLPIGHALAYGKDMDYGVDSYDAWFDFCEYNLKHAPISVSYVSPVNGEGGVKTESDIKVKFVGPVSADEVERITIKASDGSVVEGSWSSEFGNTEWTFKPLKLLGATNYTVTIPSDIKGDNGKKMGEEYVSRFVTENVDATEGKTDSAYVTIKVPEQSEGATAHELSFHVANDAANIANVYAVDSTSDEGGIFIGGVNLRGEGYYSVDVSSYVADKAGQEVIFRIDAAKAPGNFVTYSETFDSSTGGYKKGTRATLTNEDSRLKAVLTHNQGQFVNSSFYGAQLTLFTNSCIKDSNITESDYGRKFKVSFDVYDEAGRYMMIQTMSCTNKDTGTIDYDRVIFNVKNKPAQWNTIEFEYTVYDSGLGASGNHKQGFSVLSTPNGEYETPFYFDNVTVTETVTDIEVDCAMLVSRNDGGTAYKAPESDNAFSVWNESERLGDYNSFAEAVNAYKDGYTIKLHSNYVLTDASLSDKLADFENVVIDLNGYKLRSENTSSGFVNIKAVSTAVPTTNITIENGGIALKDMPLVTFNGSYASGSGKTANINLNNVTFDLLDSASVTEIICSSDVTDGVDINCNINLNNCDFYFDDDKHDDIPTEIFAAGNSGLNISYKIKGGKIRLDSQRWIFIQREIKHTEFLPDENGNYTTLTLPNSKIPAETAYLCDTGYAVYSDGVEADGYTTYTLFKSENSTRYGIIPEQYADIDEYPLVVFDPDGNCVGASSFIARDSGGGALNFASKQTEGEWIIYLRRNLTHTDPQFNNLSFVYGSVLFDLGGNKITMAEGSGRFLASHAKRGNKTQLTMKNGSVDVGSIAFMRFSSGTSDTYDGSNTKTFDYSFENIDFEGIGNSGFVTCGSFLVGCNVDLDFVDCSFELSNISSATTLINLPDTAGNLSANVTFKGCVLNSDDYSNTNLYGDFNSKSTISFVKNSAGEYIKAVAPEGAAAPDDNIPTPDGVMYFGSSVTADKVTTYTPVVNPFVTKYGVIPAEYADTDAYPFAVFKDGKFVRADKSWALAVSRPKDTLYGSSGKDGEMQILLRRDYTTTSDDSTNKLWRFVGGNVTVDLNGYTLSSGQQIPFYFNIIDTTSKTDSSVTQQHDINVKVINGSLASSNKQIAAINRYTPLTKEKKIDVTFDTVKIISSQDSGQDTIFASWNDGNDVNIPAALNFNNCTFDLSSAKSTLNVFSFAEASKLIDVTVSIKGGKIIAGSLGASTLFKLGDGDSAKFVGDENGLYTTLVMPEASTAPTVGYQTDAGTMNFAKSGTEGTDIIYSLIRLTTDYGTIPAEYASAVDYPFAVFKNGNFVRADKSLALAVSRPKDTLYGSGGKDGEMQILLRRDYTTTSIDDTSKLWRYVGGEVTVDLGGYTLTSGEQIPFNFNVADTPNKTDSSVVEQHDISVMVTGGSILSKKPIATINRSNNLTKEKKISISFESVEIISSSDSANNEIFASWNDGSGVNIPASLEFNNCSFNLTSAKSGLKVFSFAEASNLVDATVCVRGGKITATSIGAGKIFSIGDGDAFMLGKHSEAYPVIELTAGTSVSGEFDTEDGNKAKYSYDSEAGLYVPDIIEISGMQISDDGKTLKYVFAGEVPADCQNAAVVIAIYSEPGVLYDAKIGYLSGNVASVTADAFLPGQTVKYMAVKDITNIIPLAESVELVISEN